ncbi:MAG: FAD-dependent oxidoreductase [Lachnospiraceae bacterium]|nr:FAD-dependent oxidoreductase [Lachnospiraceae bacterium]
MLIVDQIRIPVTRRDPEAALLQEIAKKLHLRTEQIRECRIRRRSIDARKKPAVFYLYSVAIRVEDEPALLRRPGRGVSIRQATDEGYRLPKRSGELPCRPVVVGFGPAGMFAAYILALCGADPIVLERGREAARRKQDVERFFETGELLGFSNVQFGEGGAGTFSDGKLATQKNDRFGRNRFVLETFHRFGAADSILYDARPHIGTDRLVEIVAAMRREIQRLGGTVEFESCMESLILQGDELRGVRLADGRSIETRHLVLAIGHSARDTFASLYAQRIPMQAKPFAVGFRVEHPQSEISLHQYGREAAAVLPAAPYKLVAKGQRDLYSFCMCPGGYVINASSEPGRLCVNGMSESRRDSANANSALVLPVGAKEWESRLGKDFLPGEPLAAEGPHPLLGLQFQKHLEEAAFALGSGRIPQQLFGDFVANRSSTSFGRFASCTKGGRVFCNLRGLLGEELERDFIQGIAGMDKRFRGFYDEEMILSGIESRTSSPVRIPRDKRFQSSIKGLYPCGEGAGYAGGITSAAMDGMKVAEAVLDQDKE